MLVSFHKSTAECQIYFQQRLFLLVFLQVTLLTSCQDLHPVEHYSTLFSSVRLSFNLTCSILTGNQVHPAVVKNQTQPAVCRLSVIMAAY